MIRLGLTSFAGSRVKQGRESMPGIQRVEHPEDPSPRERAWRRKRRRVNLLTIIAGVTAFNTVVSAVAGGPTWWTLAWLVALIVAVLLMLGKLVRGV
jgi:fatty acid desaturase